MPASASSMFTVHRGLNLDPKVLRFGQNNAQNPNPARIVQHVKGNLTHAHFSTLGSFKLTLEWRELRNHRADRGVVKEFGFRFLQFQVRASSGSAWVGEPLVSRAVEPLHAFRIIGFGTRTPNQTV